MALRGESVHDRQRTECERGERKRLDPGSSHRPKRSVHEREQPQSKKDSHFARGTLGHVQRQQPVRPEVSRDRNG
jgi:hypothetical protein